VLGDSPRVIEKITKGREASLCQMNQVLDALNTFVSLIVLLRDASSQVCLNRLRTGPLGHTFGKARIQCCYVNRMLKIIGTFIGDTLTRAIDLCLDLVTLCHLRVSVGIDCSPCSRIERSMFESRVKKIAAYLLAHTGIEVTRLDIGFPETSPRDY
jgi:hypothetical protein